MAKINFIKMQGCGNDYVYIDCFKENVDGYDIEDLAVKISDRHFGVGGDGLVLICKSDVADARMRMFNADGSEGNMCGNAIRCVGKYVYDNGYVKKDKITVETKSGIKTLYINADNGIAKSVKVEMGKAEFSAPKIPVIYKNAECVVNMPFTIDNCEYNITCVSMGNPHCVVFGISPDNLEIEKVGTKFEHNAAFPERVNTEFAEIIDSKTIKMRVWERGSGETLACGTGACATVAAAVKNGFCKAGEPVTVVLRGGDLVITYTEENVIMEGKAEIVFKGEYTYDK